MGRMKYYLAVVVLLILATPVFGQEVETYVVKPGDTLYSISREFGVTPDFLIQLNELNGGVIRAGLTLKIREISPQVVQPDTLHIELQTLSSTAVASDSTSYTIASLAEAIGLSEDELLMLNPEVESFIQKLSQTLHQGGDEKGTTAGDREQEYTVRPGDTLYGIARTTGQSVSQLTELNQLGNNTLQPGQKLRVAALEQAPISYWKSVGVVETGRYPDDFNNRIMQSGLAYGPEMFVVGHNTLPNGTLLLLKPESGGPEVLCIVADRSLNVGFDVLDVSNSVAASLGTASRIEVFTLR